MTEQHKQAVLSYLRSAVAAVLAVASTGNTDPNDLLKAFVAALVPPVLRWINPKDHAFGRGSDEAA